MKKNLYTAITLVMAVAMFVMFSNSVSKALSRHRTESQLCELTHSGSMDLERAIRFAQRLISEGDMIFVNREDSIVHVNLEASSQTEFFAGPIAAWYDVPGLSYYWQPYADWHVYNDTTTEHAAVNC